MNFELISSNLGQLGKEKSDVLALLLPISALKSVAKPKSKSAPAQAGLDAGLQKELADAVKAGDWSAETGSCLSLYQVAGFAAKRVLLIGVGEGSVAEVKKALTQGLAGALAGASSLTIALHYLPEPEQYLGAIAQAISDASYVYTHTKPSAKARKLGTVSLATEVKASAELKTALQHAKALFSGVELAKEWGNRPANHATPSHLAGVAADIAKRGKNIRCEVLGPKAIEKLKMGAFLAVTKGSVEPAQFIVLQYLGGAKSSAPVVLVGKGISFDTGGISLKPVADMDEMKFDMCGAASVLGTFQALAALQPKLNVIGLIPTCENMPSGAAIKPGDVVTSMSGQTIEILNTDAEGRLILCDALTYAERFKPRAVVDIATLTGACIIALGHLRSAMYANDDELAVRLTLAGEDASDPCWRMPLDEDYALGLKSNFADIANVAGSRAGGSITAAKYLQKFTKAYPWAHLDIAGIAFKSGKEKGSTGRPVPLLLNYVLSYID